MSDDLRVPAPNESVRYFGCPDLIKFPLGSEVLAYSSATRRKTILTRTQANLLGLCRTPRTLDEHARFCRRQLDRAPLETIREALAALVESGHLMPEEYVRDLCRQVAGVDDAAPKIDRLGVVTCNRPGQLRRCLVSYVSNARENGRDVGYVVADDTRDEGGRRGTRGMLAALGREHGIEIAYLGAEEKRRLADLLASAGQIPPDVVDFALFDVEGCGVSIGANRNALLLYTSGELALSTDDDVFCQVARHPEARDELAVGSLEPFNSYRFFADRGAALSSVEFTDVDVLAAHEALLGAAVASRFAAADGDSAPHLRDIDPYLFRGLVSGSARIRLTYAGTIGDSALRSHAKFLHLDGDSRAALLESEADYRRACRSREVLRCVSRPVITKNSWCMTGAYAFDNRELLPPFFPTHRNEDGLYGETLRLTLRDACYAHLPYALLHDPPEARSYVKEGANGAAPFLHSSHVVIACLRTFDAPLRLLSASDCVIKLGEHLEAIGRLDLPEFAEFVHLQLLRQQSAQASALEGLLLKHQRMPAYWAEDTERHLEALRKSLLRSDGIHPENFPGDSREQVLLRLRGHVGDFGRLLCWWPTMVEAARGIDISRVRGSRPA